MSQNTDFEWYKENLKDLYKLYGEQIVVIKDRKVESTHSSFVDAFEAGCRNFKVGTFIIQKLGPDEAAYTNYIHSLSGVVDGEWIPQIFDASEDTYLV